MVIDWEGGVESLETSHSRRLSKVFLRFSGDCETSVRYILFEKRMNVECCHHAGLLRGVDFELMRHDGRLLLGGEIPNGSAFERLC
jgi:hypothetical protein